MMTEADAFVAVVTGRAEALCDRGRAECGRLDLLVDPKPFWEKPLAVLVLDPSATAGLGYLRKLNMQLTSKMRFVSAQLIAILTDDLYLRPAGHANAMAARLREAVDGLPGLTITQQTQSNAVFAILPPGVADLLHDGFRFYDWDPATGEVRWMCAFDTMEADVDAFAAALRVELAAVVR